MGLNDSIPILVKLIISFTSGSDDGLKVGPRRVEVEAGQVVGVEAGQVVGVEAGQFATGLGAGQVVFLFLYKKKYTINNTKNTNVVNKAIHVSTSIYKVSRN
jgi:hypothetical protein